MKTFGTYSDIQNVNLALNSNMRVSQRGDYSSLTAAVNNTYYIDRWKVNLDTATANIQHISTNQPSLLRNSKSFRITATNSVTGYFGYQQNMEDISILWGQTVTFSKWVKSNTPAAFIGVFTYPTADYNFTSNFHSGNGEWELLHCTGVIPFGSTIVFLNCFTGSKTSPYRYSVNSGDYIESTGAVLQLGSNPILLTPRIYQEELKLCQRYFNRLNFSGTFRQFAVAHGDNSTTNLVGFVPLNEPLRASPTIILSGSDYRALEGGAAHGISPNITSLGANSCGVNISATITSGALPAALATCTLVVSHGYIQFDAEMY